MYQEEVKSAIILLYLGILAGMDVRKRQISLVLTGVLFLAGIGWQILVEQTSWLEWLLSLLPGAGFLRSVIYHGNRWDTGTAFCF